MFARVVFDYEAREEGELTIHEGDEVEVLDTDDAWWIGRIGDREGEFPSNYVTVDEITLQDGLVETDGADDELPPEGNSRSTSPTEAILNELPCGWAMAFDQETGDPYYYDRYR